MKRSKSIGLTLMGTMPFLLAACEQPRPPGPPLPAYGSVSDCVQARIFTQQACESGQAAAMQAYQAEAPKFTDQQDCEQQYGANNCQPVQTASGGSWFAPAMAGFMVGQMMGGRGGYGGYGGEPLYRDRGNSNNWRTAGGQTINKQSKAVTRSRGGFGSRAAARGRWGGWGS